MKNLQPTTDNLRLTTYDRHRRTIVVTAITCLLFVVGYAAPAMALNIDATNKYAWGENIGWINFGSTEGDVDVSTTAMDGYAWAENAGWISLTCANTSSCGTVDYGVTISGSTVAGYAWGENVGWISFNCSNTSSCGTVDYSVSLDTATGDFSGYAWGENVGWIVFNCSTTASCGNVNYKLKTSATLTTPTPTPTPGGGGVIILGTPPTAPSPTPSISPSVSPTASPTPSLTVAPTPTAPPPSIVPAALPPSGGGFVGGVIQTISSAAQAFDEVIARVLGEVTAPEVAAVAAGASVAVTVVALIPIVVAAAGAVAQKEVAASVFQLFQIVGIRKRPKVWGVVYDSSTKRPIPLAKIELIDATGRVLETRYADRDGRYGFLTSPSSLHTPELRVRIRALKLGYAFPTAHTTMGTDFVVYNNAYHGDELILHGDALVKYDIPVDPIVRGRTSVGMSLWHVLGAIGDRLLSLGFFIGLIVVPLNLWFLPNTTNTVIFTVFFLVNGIQIFVLHRPYGVTIDALTGKRLPFALVTLNDVQGNRVGFAVSDERGRFILSGEQNKDYELLAYTPANVVPQRSIRMGIRGLRRISTRAWITTTIRI